MKFVTAKFLERLKVPAVYLASFREQFGARAAVNLRNLRLADKLGFSAFCLLDHLRGQGHGRWETAWTRFEEDRSPNRKRGAELHTAFLRIDLRFLRQARGRDFRPWS